MNFFCDTRNVADRFYRDKVANRSKWHALEVCLVIRVVVTVMTMTDCETPFLVSSCTFSTGSRATDRAIIGSQGGTIFWLGRRSSTSWALGSTPVTLLGSASRERTRGSSPVAWRPRARRPRDNFRYQPDRKSPSLLGQRALTAILQLASRTIGAVKLFIRSAKQKKSSLLRTIVFTTSLHTLSFFIRLNSSALV